MDRSQTVIIEFKKNFVSKENQLSVLVAVLRLEHSKPVSENVYKHLNLSCDILIRDIIRSLSVNIDVVLRQVNSDKGFQSADPNHVSVKEQVDHEFSKLTV